ncbi:MAG: methyltransferase domain-containing protein [Solirubrobacterales bacterium]|nr:methyltransferase domain-containing protein [Solirubrobacterales bacterium]OJU95110.1 MAG: hypothetical protein BGO23_10525 [Solirubrobacterales bacterium 67-14]
MPADHFDEIAGEYDESLPPHVVEHYLTKRTAWVKELLGSGTVLDVGCGTGVLAGRLAAAGFDVTGVDPSAGMLAEARRQVSGAEFVEGSGTDLPFEDGSFDLTLCVAVMHHVADPADVERTLAEMVRVTRSGGQILVWDHNPRNPYWKLLMARVPQDDGSERLIPEAEVTGGLAAAGAVVLESRQSGFVPDFVPPRFLRLAAGVERGVERVPGVKRLCAHNVVVAKKP